jgi:hypothetical protein
MRHVGHALAAFGFILAVTAPTRADDAADARALVEKAVKAHGGQDKLDKLPGHTLKFKGKFHGMGQAIDMTGEVASQGNDKQKVDVEVEAGGMKFRFTVVVSGDKGWTRMGDEVKEMSKDEVAEAKEQAFAGWVATLAPLKDKQFTLATTGETTIEKKTALGVKVSSKGHRDVDLYFDKETGLLIKSETRVKDDGSGQEVSEETFYEDYKEVQGTKQAMKFATKRDGKLFLELDITELTLADKLDASTFAKP